MAKICRVATQAPLDSVDLEIEKSFNSLTAFVGGGGTYIYKLDWANNGPDPSNTITITDSPSSYFSFNSASSTPGWTETFPGSNVYTFTIPGPVPAGASGSVLFAVTADDILPLSLTNISNSVNISSNNTDSNPSNNNDVITTTVRGNSRIKVEKVSLSGTHIDVGETVLYEITVSNNGNREAENVLLTDVFSNLMSFNAALSSPGWSLSGNTLTRTIPLLSTPQTFIVALTALPGAYGEEITNTANVTPDETNVNDTSPASDLTDSVNINVGGEADLSVTKSFTQTGIFLGSSKEYKIVVVNNGPDDAYNVNVVEQPNEAIVPNNTANSSFVQSPPGTYTAVIPFIAAGNSVTLSFFFSIVDVIPPGVQDMQNDVSVSSDQSDPDLSNNTFNDNDTFDIQQGQGDNLEISKSDGQTTVNVGETLVYTIDYSNLPPSVMGTENTKIIEVLPLDTTFNPAMSTLGWTMTSPGTYEFFIGDLAVGNSGTVNFAVTVDNLAVGTTLTNTATLEGEAVNGIKFDTDTDTTSVNGTPLGLDLAVTKTANISEVTTGETIVYTVNWVNNGPATSSDITILDTIPEHTTFNAALSDSALDLVFFNTKYRMIIPGPVPAGTSGSFDIAFDVDNTIPGSGETGIENVLEISSNEVDDDPSNNNFTLFTPFVDVARDLAVTKTVDNNNPSVGDVITYTVNWANNGNAGASNVKINEILPANTIITGGYPPNTTVTSATGFTVSLVGQLPPGATYTFNFSVTVLPGAAGTTLSNTVNTTGGGALSELNPADNTFTLNTPVNP